MKNAGLNFAIVKKSWTQVYKSLLISEPLLSFSFLTCNLENNIYLQIDCKVNDVTYIKYWSWCLEHNSIQKK